MTSQKYTLTPDKTTLEPTSPSHVTFRIVILPKAFAFHVSLLDHIM